MVQPIPRNIIKLIKWNTDDPNHSLSHEVHQSSLTIRVNQLKTNHPNHPIPSPRPTINQLITIQSHDNHTTTPERNPTQSAITHSLDHKITTNPLIPNQTNYRWPHENHTQLKSKSNRGDQWRTWPTRITPTSTTQTPPITTDRPRNPTNMIKKKQRKQRTRKAHQVSENNFDLNQKKKKQMNMTL